MPEVELLLKAVEAYCQTFSKCCACVLSYQKCVREPTSLHCLVGGYFYSLMFLKHILINISNCSWASKILIISYTALHVQTFIYESFVLSAVAKGLGIGTP